MVTKADLLARIGRLEDMKRALAMEQAVVVRDLAREYVRMQMAAGVTDPEELERGIVAQIRLALPDFPKGWA
jgi:hypothetical protein